MGKLRQTTAKIQELLDKVENGEAGGGGLKYAVERTAYVTKASINIGGKIEEEEDYEITDEQRAYNIETLEMAARGDSVIVITDGAIFSCYGTVVQGDATANVYFASSVLFDGGFFTLELGLTNDGNAEGTISDGNLGLQYSTERTLYGIEEEEMTEEQNAYNRMTYSMLKAGEHVTINVEGMLFPMIDAGDGTYEWQLSQMLGEVKFTGRVLLHEDGSVTIPELISDPLIIDVSDPASMLAFFNMSDLFYFLKPAIMASNGVAHVNCIYLDTYNGNLVVVLCVTAPMQNVAFVVDYETGVLLDEKYYPFGEAFGVQKMIQVVPNMKSEINRLAFEEIAQAHANGSPYVVYTNAGGMRYWATGILVGQNSHTIGFSDFIGYTETDTDGTIRKKEYSILLSADGTASYVTELKSEIDGRMKDNSENPVQNKVIKAYIDEQIALALGK